MVRPHVTDRPTAEAIVGCMMSGKSSLLLNRVSTATRAGYEVTLYTSETDTRYDEQAVATHNGDAHTAHVIDSATDVFPSASSADLVAIDELEFFDGDELVSVVSELLASGVSVVGAGLDQTYRGTPFMPTMKYAAIADHITQLRAVCEQCGDVATRTQRLLDGEPAPASADTIVVGGDELYEPRCHDCHTVPSRSE